MAATRCLHVRRAILLAGIGFLCAQPVHAQYGGGAGEPNDPYLIYTAEQMNAIGAEPNDWDRHFKLMADIDLAELGDRQFNIIGTDLKLSDRDGTVIADLTGSFAGIFDGNGHAISGFVCTSASAKSVGLFGVVDGPNAEIRNLRLLAPRIDVRATAIGSLVGTLRAGTLFNCHAEDVEIRGQWANVGGLVGESGVFQSTTATIRRCSSAGRVSAQFRGMQTGAGGLVGKD